MDAQDIRNLSEAYLDVYQVDEANRGERHLDLNPDETVRRRQQPMNRGGYKSEEEDNQRKIWQRRGSGGVKGGDPSLGKTVWQGGRAPDGDQDRERRRTHKISRGVKTKGRGVREQADIYDIILSHLLDEAAVRNRGLVDAGGLDNPRKDLANKAIDASGRKVPTHPKGLRMIHTHHSAARLPSGELKTKPRNKAKKNAYYQDQRYGKGSSGLNYESYDIYNIILSHLLDEGYANTFESAKNIIEHMSEDWRDEILDELYKGKHGQSETEYMDSRSQGGKMISGDSERSGAAWSHRSYKGVGKPAKPGERQQHQGRMDSGTRTDVEYRKKRLRNRNA